MSLSSWKEEFYKVDAWDVEESEALAHSLKKWQGLTYDNMQRHGVMRSRFAHIEEIESDEIFRIDVTTCSLCRHFKIPRADRFDEESEEFFAMRDLTQTDRMSRCVQCPLYEVLGLPCDMSRGAAPELQSPYYRWTSTGNPRPMIDALERTLFYYQVKGLVQNARSRRAEQD